MGEAKKRKKKTQGGLGEDREQRFNYKLAATATAALGRHHFTCRETGLAGYKNHVIVTLLASVQLTL